jgi:hypothetical protein
MPRQIKEYGFDGLAGCVVIRKSRITGSRAGLYHSMQAGIETDPELPWVTLCEDHATMVCHGSLALAKEALPDPSVWCEECRKKIGASGVSSGP